MVDVADFYENQEPGLGNRFLDDMDRGLCSITKKTNAWPIISDSIRKKVLNRFPYSILYRVKKSTIFILAVMHHRRLPKYWKNRRG